MANPANFIYFTRSPTTGKVRIWKTPAFEMLSSTDLAQDGISTTPRRPCIVRFRGDTYVVGSFSRPIYYAAKDPGWWPAGIMPPPSSLVVNAVAGVSTVGSVGVGLCYITYQHRVGEVMLAESNPSNVVQVTLTGNGRTWLGLLAPRKERRVTHVAGYCSMNGSNYRRAFLAPYGLSTIEENNPTSRLTIQGPDGNYLPPNGCAFATEFAGRMWYACTSEHPYRLWFSDPGEPQYVGLASLRDTLERDTITGMRKCQNILLVGTATCCYGIRNFGTSGFVMEKLDSSIGVLSHFGMLEVHNKLWFPSQDGYFIFDGASFYFAMKDIRPYWLADRKANSHDFDGGLAIDDRIGKNILFITTRQNRANFEGYTAPGTIIYVANYLNFERTMGGGQEQPDWSLDVRTRFDYASFYGLDNVLYFGSEDGKIRNEDEDNGNDDGDTLAKPLLIEWGHMLFGEPGDDVEQGKTLEDLWVYAESEYTAWSAYVLMGDEWAAQRIEPNNTTSHWKINVAASALTQAIDDPAGGTQLAVYTPETTHYLGVPEGVSGRGLTMRVRATSPIRMKVRGFGGIWAPGPAPRHESELITFVLSGP